MLLATADPAVAFFALALVFAAGALAAIDIRSPFQPSRRANSTIRQVLLEPLRGFQALLAEPEPRVLFGLAMMQTTMRGLVNVFVVVLALSSFNDQGQAGNLFAAIGVGGLLGAVVTLGGGGVQRSALWYAVGITLWGIPVALIGAWPNPVVAWCALAVLGLGNAIADIYGFSLLNRLIRDDVAGRAWGAFHSTSAAVIAVGSLSAPLLIDLLGLSWAMGITGAVLALSPLLLWYRLRTVDAAAAASPAIVELLQQVPALAPMTGIALERLARSAQRVDFLEGESVVCEGDPGELFYVVVDGQLAVTQAGRERRKLGAGAAFGEIALLKSLPRTATVTSVGSSRLLSIDGDSFVAAVTGHRVAERLAQDAAADVLRGDERLASP